MGRIAGFHDLRVGNAGGRPERNYPDKSCHCEAPQATMQSRPEVGTIAARWFASLALSAVDSRRDFEKMKTAIKPKCFMMYNMIVWTGSTQERRKIHRFFGQPRFHRA
jgi:hypothetical protein